MLYETRGKTPQKYKNEFPFENVRYTITHPADYATKKIIIDEKTGELTFENQPATVVVQAADDQGKTATYTFTVTDHFPSRAFFSSVVVGSEIYVLGGEGKSRKKLNDVWKSTDGGKNWINVHAK